MKAGFVAGIASDSFVPRISNINDSQIQKSSFEKIFWYLTRQDHWLVVDYNTQIPKWTFTMYRPLSNIFVYLKVERIA